MVVGGHGRRKGKKKRRPPRKKRKSRRKVNDKSPPLFLFRGGASHNGPREVNGFFIRPKEIQKDILETHSALSHTCFQIKTFRSDDAATLAKYHAAGGRVFFLPT